LIAINFSDFCVPSKAIFRNLQILGGLCLAFIEKNLSAVFITLETLNKKPCMTQ